MLLADQAKPDFSAGDPYDDLSGISGSLGQEIIKSSRDYNMGEVLGSALITGMLGGGFEGASKNYRSGQRADYTKALLGNITGNLEKPEDLDDSLFDVAKQNANYLKVLETVEEKRDEQKLKSELKKTIAEETLKNPRNAARGIEALRGLGLLDDDGPRSSPLVTDIEPKEPAAAKPDPVSARVRELLGDRFEGGTPESLDAKTSRIAQRMMDEGATPGAAYDTAAKMVDAERLALKGATKKSDEVRAGANLMLQLADTAEAGMMGAGETGGILGGPRDIASKLYSLVSNEETQQRADQKVLDSIRPELVKAMRSPGAVSDLENKLAIGAGPSSASTPQENARIIEKMRGAGKLNLEYADFLDWYRDKYSSTSGAEKIWQAYKADHPLVVKEGNRVEFNRERPSVFEWLQGGGSGAGSSGAGGDILAPRAASLISPKAPRDEDPGPLIDSDDPDEGGLIDDVTDVAGEFGRNAVSLDGLRAMVDPKTYKEGFKSAEAAAETIGTGAAMTAGAVAGGQGGAMLGAMTGPFAPVASPLLALLGAGVGAGAGYLGFGSAEEGASELAGVGTEKPVIPGKEEFMEAARAGGQTVLPTGGIKVLGKGARLAKGAVNKTAAATENIVQAVKEDVAGVRPGNIEAVLKEKPVKFFDESGREVPVADATQYKTALDQSLKLADQDGFFEQVSNDPKSTKLVLEKKLATAKKTIDDLHAEAELALKEAHAELPAAQQRQFPLERDPKTGKGGFSPDFSSAKAQIADIARTDPQMVKALTTRLQKVERSWLRSSRSYAALQDWKATLGSATRWTKGMTDVSNAWNQVKQTLYGAFKDTQLKAFDYAMPERIGDLGKANALFHAYSNLEPIINKTASKGKPALKVGWGGKDLPGSYFERNRSSKLALVEGADSAAQGASKALDTLSEGRIGSALRASEKAGGSSGAALGANRAEALELDEFSLMQDSSRHILDMEDDGEEMSVREIEAQIDSDPLDSAIYEAESSRNPKAKNPKSSAGGGFQLISSTAKNLGVKDRFNLAENYAGYKKLRADTEKKFGTDDPRIVYGVHFLGEPLLRKVLNEEALSKQEQAIVEEFRTKAMPRVLAIYERKLGAAKG